MKWIFSSIFGIMGVIFLVIGCPMVMGAAGLYYYLDTATQDWVKVNGTVISMYQSESRDSDTGSYTTVYCPTVEYNIGDETLRVDTNECASPPMYEVGDTVEVSFDPQNPNNMKLEGGVQDLVGTIVVWVFGILGAVFLVVGGVGTIVAVVAAFWRGRNA